MCLEFNWVLLNVTQSLDKVFLFNFYICFFYLYLLLCFFFSQVVKHFQGILWSHCITMTFIFLNSFEQSFLIPNTKHAYTSHSFTTYFYFIFLSIFFLYIINYILFFQSTFFFFTFLTSSENAVDINRLKQDKDKPYRL